MVVITERSLICTFKGATDIELLTLFELMGWSHADMSLNTISTTMVGTVPFAKLVLRRTNGLNHVLKESR